VWYVTRKKHDTEKEQDDEKEDGGNISWHLSPTLSQFSYPRQTQLWAEMQNQRL